jgi:hypothetical protein
MIVHSKETIECAAMAVVIICLEYRQNVCVTHVRCMILINFVPLTEQVSNVIG